MSTSSPTIYTHSHQGIALIEVLISLVLLAVAIMGFSLLQMTSIKSTDESLIRTNANTYSNSIAEIMRNNVASFTQIRSVISTGVFAKDCDTVACTESEKAQFEIKKIKNLAASQGIVTNMIICPGTAGRQETNCLILAWDNTTATVGAQLPNCVTDAGVYVRGSACLIMEIY